MRIIARFHEKFPPSSLILRYFGLQNYSRVVDLGCGNGSVLRVFNNKYKMGVEAFSEYLESSRSKNIHHEYLLEDINKLNLKKFLKDFDAVIVFDVLEHLTLDQARNLVDAVESSPNIKFAAFRTPSIYLDQDDLDGNDFQRHKSHLPTSYFKERGYKVFGVDGPLFVNVKEKRARGEFSLFLSLLSLILRPFYLFLPDKSMNYLAILKK